MVWVTFLLIISKVTKNNWLYFITKSLQIDQYLLVCNGYFSAVTNPECWLSSVFSSHHCCPSASWELWRWG